MIIMLCYKNLCSEKAARKLTPFKGLKTQPWSLVTKPITIPHCCTKCWNKLNYQGTKVSALEHFMILSFSNIIEQKKYLKSASHYLTMEKLSFTLVCPSLWAQSLNSKVKVWAARSTIWSKCLSRTEVSITG